MTPEEHLKTMQLNLNRLKTMDWFLPLASKIHNAMLKRIFIDGISGSNEKIGDYSSTPFYAPVKTFIKPGVFQPQGKKSSLQVFKNGKVRKTMYLQQGYRQLKQIQGLSTTVNFSYTGSLQQDLSTSLSVSAGGIVVKLSSAVNQNKLTRLKKKYGNNIFEYTSQEKEQFTKDVTRAIIDCLTF